MLSIIVARVLWIILFSHKKKTIYDTSRLGNIYKFLKQGKYNDAGNLTCTRAPITCEFSLPSSDPNIASLSLSLARADLGKFRARSRKAKMRDVGRGPLLIAVFKQSC